MQKNTIQVADKFAVVPTSEADDCAIYNVVDISGKVVSAAPMPWREAVKSAQFRDADHGAEQRQLAASERE